jgi:twitching motility protein PilT
MATPLEDLLSRAVESHASDIHLKVGSPPTIRIGGELRRMQDLPSLTPDDTAAYAERLCGPTASAKFEETGEADFAFGRHDIGRFRVSIFRQRGSVSLVLRRVEPGVPSLDRIGLPPITRRIASEARGLMLVTGPAGSGRTTSVASIVEEINSTKPVSIVTVEDPIEFLFPDKMAVVVQREVGVDTPTFSHAVRRAMRQDADVIMLSEIADTDTAMAALAAAETGHFVVGAMHTSDPAETVERFVGLFPAAERATARTLMAAHLRGVISQRLVDTADGAGRVLAAEVLTSAGRVPELIQIGAEKDAYLEAIKESEFFGMQTFDNALLALVKQGRVDVQTALPFVRNGHEFRARAMEAGIEA